MNVNDIITKLRIINMSIHYAFKPTMVRGQEGKFIATVVPTYALKFEDAITEVAERAGCSVGVVQNVMSAYMDVIKRHIANGATVQVGNIGRLYPSLSGSYASQNETADKDNLNINFTVSRPYAMELIANVSLEKVTSIPREPVITACHDHTLNAENVFTVGGILTLNGDNLEFDEHNTDEGVFIEAVGHNGLFRVDSYGQHGEKRIEFSLPNTLFTTYGASVVTTAGLMVTVKSSYGTQTLRSKEYGTPIYEGAFAGSTRFTGFAGLTGVAKLRAIRDDVGPGIKMAYMEPGSSAFGTAVAIANSAEEASYTLAGVDTDNTLTVKVRGEVFYEYVASTGIVNGESVNMGIFVM